MAGGNNNPKPLFINNNNNKPSSHHRKSHWESRKNPHPDKKPADNPKTPAPPPPSNSNSKYAPKSAPKPSPNQPKPPSNPNPHPGFRPSPSQAPPLLFPDLGPRPPLTYRFHMFDRRTIALADGSVRSYFALPPDYQNFTPQPWPMDPLGRFFPLDIELPGPGFGFDRQFPRGGPMSPEFRDRDEAFMSNRNQDYWNSLDGRPPVPENPHTRKYGDEGERSGREKGEANDVFARQRHQLLQNGNVNVPSNTYRLDNNMGNSRGEDSRVDKYMRDDGGGFENLQSSRHMHNEVDLRRIPVGVGGGQEEEKEEKLCVGVVY